MGRAKGKFGQDFLDECVAYLEMNLDVRGLEKLPSNEGNRYYTIVSNHPLGGEDGVALGSILCHKYDSKIKYLVNDVLMNLEGLALFPNVKLNTLRNHIIGNTNYQ